MPNVVQIKFQMSTDSGIGAAYDITEKFIRHIPELLPLHEAECCCGALANIMIMTACDCMSKRKASTEDVQTWFAQFFELLVESTLTFGIKLTPDSIAGLISNIQKKRLKE